MKNTWLEISLGSLTSLFPDFHRMCLSCQEKLRQHFMSKMSNCEIPSCSSTGQPQKAGGKSRLTGRWNEIAAFLPPALCLCVPCGSVWLWWPLSWQRFLSQQKAHSPPSVQAIKSRCAGRALMWCTPVGWFHSLAAVVGCLPGKLEKKPKRI